MSVGVENWCKSVAFTTMRYEIVEQTGFGSKLPLVYSMPATLAAIYARLRATFKSSLALRNRYSYIQPNFASLLDSAQPTRVHIRARSSPARRRRRRSGRL